MRAQELAIWDDVLTISLEEAAFPRPAVDAAEPVAIQKTEFPRTSATPDIGEVVRWKGSAFGCRKGTTGRVKDMVSRDDGSALVIQSIWGAEFTVATKEYHYFFEICDPGDPAYAYWANS